MQEIPRYVLSIAYGRPWTRSALTLCEVHGTRPTPTLHVVEATYLPQGTGYPQIADEIKRRYDALNQGLRTRTYGSGDPEEYISHRALLAGLDYSGTRAFDELHQRGLRGAIHITSKDSGLGFERVARGYIVTRTDLMTSLAILFQYEPQPHITISETLPQVKSLVRDFCTKGPQMNPAGQLQPSDWCDVLLMSLMLTAWEADSGDRWSQSKV